MVDGHVFFYGHIMVLLAAACMECDPGLVVVDFHHALGKDQLYFLSDIGVGHAVIVLVGRIIGMAVLLYGGDLVVPELIFLQGQ